MTQNHTEKELKHLKQQKWDQNKRDACQYNEKQPSRKLNNENVRSISSGSHFIKKNPIQIIKHNPVEKLIQVLNSTSSWNNETVKKAFILLYPYPEQYEITSTNLSLLDILHNEWIITDIINKYATTAVSDARLTRIKETSITSEDIESLNQLKHVQKDLASLRLRCYKIRLKLLSLKMFRMCSIHPLPSVDQQLNELDSLLSVKNISITLEFENKSHNTLTQSLLVIKNNLKIVAKKIVPLLRAIFATVHPATLPYPYHPLMNPCVINSMTNIALPNSTLREPDHYYVIRLLIEHRPTLFFIKPGTQMSAQELKNELLAKSQDTQWQMYRNEMIDVLRFLTILQTNTVVDLSIIFDFLTPDHTINQPWETFFSNSVATLSKNTFSRLITCADFFVPALYFAVAYQLWTLKQNADSLTEKRPISNDSTENLVSENSITNNNSQRSISDKANNEDPVSNNIIKLYPIKNIKV